MLFPFHRLEFDEKILAQGSQNGPAMQPTAKEEMLKKCQQLTEKHQETFYKNVKMALHENHQNKETNWAEYAQ